MSFLIEPDMNFEHLTIMQFLISMSQVSNFELDMPF